MICIRCWTEEFSNNFSKYSSIYYMYATELYFLDLKKDKKR